MDICAYIKCPNTPKGEANPVVDNKTTEGRVKNRPIEAELKLNSQVKK